MSLLGVFGSEWTAAFSRYLDQIMAYNNSNPYYSSASSSSLGGRRSAETNNYYRRDREGLPRNEEPRGIPPSRVVYTQSPAAVYGEACDRNSRAMRMIPNSAAMVRCDQQPSHLQCSASASLAIPTGTVTIPITPEPIAAELESFCVKFEIPPACRPWILTSQTTQDRVCVAFKLPPGVSASGIANSVSEFVSRQLGGGSQKVAMDTREQNDTGVVRLAWARNETPTQGAVGQYSCMELAYTNSMPEGFELEGVAAGQKSPVLVKFSRPGNELTAEDARVIELALYLGFVRPPTAPPAHGMFMRSTMSSHMLGGRSMLPSLFDNMFDNGDPFSLFWEPFRPFGSFFQPPMMGQIPSFEQMFEALPRPSHSYFERSLSPNHQLTGAQTDYSFRPLLDFWQQTSTTPPQLCYAPSSSNDSSSSSSSQSYSSSPHDYYRNFHSSERIPEERLNHMNRY